jgi:hypothetical protein
VGTSLDDALRLLASNDILSQTPVASVEILRLSLSAVQNGRLESVESNIARKHHTRRQASHTRRTFGFHELISCLATVVHQHTYLG